MKLTIAKLAKILNGEFIGEGSTSLSNLAKIEEAKEGDITFISNTRYLPWLYKTGASVTIIDKGLEYDKDKIKNLIMVDDAYLSFKALSLIKTVCKPETLTIKSIKPMLMNSTMRF